MMSIITIKTIRWINDAIIPNMGPVLMTLHMNPTGADHAEHEVPYHSEP